MTRILAGLGALGVGHLHFRRQNGTYLVYERKAYDAPLIAEGAFEMKELSSSSAMTA